MSIDAPYCDIVMSQHSSDRENATGLNGLIASYLKHETAPRGQDLVEHHQIPTEEIVHPELAQYGRGQMIYYVNYSPASKKGIPCMTDERLATAIENRKFNFQEFGRKMKVHCQNHSGKTDERYVNALALTGQDLAEFGTVMTALCLISPTPTRTFEARDREWYKAFGLERWVASRSESGKVPHNINPQCQRNPMLIHSLPGTSATITGKEP